MKNIAIAFFGLFTSILVTSGLVFTHQRYEFSLFSLFMFFIVPAGAIIAGGLAALGYYLGARLLHAKPTPGLCAYIFAISVFCYFLFHFVNYQIEEVGGKPLSHIIGFGEYLELVFTNASFSLRRGNVSTGALGMWGYVLPLFDMLGFSAGGIFVYWTLTKKPFCDLCEKFFAKDLLQWRYFSEDDAEKMVQSVGQLAEVVQSNDLLEIRQFHDQSGAEKQPKKAPLRTELRVDKCPDCDRKVVSLESQRFHDEAWTPIPDLSFSETLPGIRERDAAFLESA